jgi:hypothetical protein
VNGVTNLVALKLYCHMNASGMPYEIHWDVNSDIEWRCNNCTDVYQPDNFGLLPAEYHDQIQNQADQPMQLVPHSDSDMFISSDESPTDLQVQHQQIQLL